MKYLVKLKHHKDFTAENYNHCGNTLYEMRNGYKYAIQFNSLEEAKKACIEYNAYGIINIDDDMCIYAWYNPNYKSKEDKAFEELRKYLGRILLPH